MTRRDWWLGVSVLAAGLLLHAVFPRYEWHAHTPQTWITYDRWTGDAYIERYERNFPVPNQ